jgi:hypothetical protein
MQSTINKFRDVLLIKVDIPGLLRYLLITLKPLQIRLDAKKSR